MTDSTVNSSETQPPEQESGELTAERKGLPGATETKWANRVRIDGQDVQFNVKPFSNLGAVTLEATREFVENHEARTIEELQKKMPDLSEEEILEMARIKTEETKEELSSLPGLMLFLNRNNTKIQEIAVDEGMSYVDDGRSDSVETYFGGKGIPLGAEHYFLTTIKDKGELMELMSAYQSPNNNQYTVREFYTSSASAGSQRRLGFKVFGADENKPDMVFLFAEDLSSKKTEVESDENVGQALDLPKAA